MSPTSKLHIDVKFVDINTKLNRSGWIQCCKSYHHHSSINLREWQLPEFSANKGEDGTLWRGRKKIIRRFR